MTPPIQTAKPDHRCSTWPIGRAVRVIRCEAREHGDNAGCVCHLIGCVERITKRYDTPFAGTASYHSARQVQRVRLSEVEILEGAEIHG